MKKKKVYVLASALAAIALCASLIAGATFALFTSNSSVNISVTSGKVDVVATVDKDSLKLTSMGKSMENGAWENGGSVGFIDKDELELASITPGDAATFDIKITNNSNVDVKYRVGYAVEGTLADALEVTVTGQTDGAWKNWYTTDAKEKTVSVSVELPEAVDNAYQDSKANIAFMVEAVQGNAATQDAVTVATAADFENALTAACQENAEPVEVVLHNDIVLEHEVYVNGAKVPVTINGNGYTITASANYGQISAGQFQLIKVFNTEEEVVIKNITLEHSYVEAVQSLDKPGSYHTLDIHTAGNVVLENVTLIRNIAAGKGGAPLVINRSNVTVKGELNLVAGGTSWYGANVDAGTLDLTEATVSYLDADDLYAVRGAIVAELSNELVKYVPGTLIEVSSTANGVQYGYMVVVAKVGETGYATVEAAVTAIEGAGTVELYKDVEINKPLYLKQEYYPNLTNLTLNGNNHTVSASAYFRPYGTTGQYALVKIQELKNVTLKNITLKHGALDQNANNYSTLDIYGADTGAATQVELENVALYRDFASTRGGAALVLNQNCEVTVKGDFKVVVSGSAWYGINVGKANSTLNMANANLDFIGEGKWVIGSEAGTINYDTNVLEKKEIQGWGCVYALIA